MYLDDPIRQWKSEAQEIHLTRDRVSILFFADDQLLLAKHENELQHSQYSLSMIIQNCNLKISIKKFKPMVFYQKQPTAMND
jgi:hypothetical protein